MKIQKIFTAISYIVTYRVLAISGMIFIIGITINKIRLNPDMPTKVFVIFITTLGLFLIISLLFVAEKQEKNKMIRKGGKNE